MPGLFIESVRLDWDNISKDSYLRTINAIKGINRIDLNKSITFLVGENGTGKSTLLEAIAVSAGFNAEGGTKNYDFSTYDSHSELCEATTLVRGNRREKWGYFLRAESFYNVATKEMEYSELYGTPERLHEKSHGESFLYIVREKFKKEGLYLLDEPEAALSPQRQLTLLIEMQKLADEGAQFIVVSHSPILLGMNNAEILSFDEGSLHTVEYEETDSYKVTEMFINNREMMLNHLLK